MDNPCYLCGKKDIKTRPGKVRDKPCLKVLECKSCGLVFLSSFSHINEGFYESSGMHGGDANTEEWIRETEWDDERRYNFLFRVLENKSVLDFGCGNGGFLIKAKEIARQIKGVEPETSLRTYFLRKELEVFPNIDEVSGYYDVITLFHVLEHVIDPKNILTKLAGILNDGGQIIVEVPNANDAMIGLYRSEPFLNFTYWSCHLFLFTGSTLNMLAEQAGLKANYIKQIQRYPLSNHLYWLARGTPGGHQKWSFLDSPDLNAAYEKQLASIGCCDTIIASFSKREF